MASSNPESTTLPSTPNRARKSVSSNSSRSSAMSSPFMVKPIKEPDPFGTPLHSKSNQTSNQTLDEQEESQNTIDNGDQDQDDDDMEILESITAHRARPSEDPILIDDPDSPMESVEEVDASPTDQTNTISKALQIRSYHPQLAVRARSAPPKSFKDALPKYKKPPTDTVDRSNRHVLPPPGTPIYVEILAYVQRWEAWAASIDDSRRRNEVVNAIAGRMENVWKHTIKARLAPKKVPTGTAQSSDLETQKRLDEEQELEERKRKAAERPDPFKAVIVEIKRNTNFDRLPRTQDYSITAGELLNAGISWKRVIKRVAIGDNDASDIIDRVKDPKTGQMEMRQWRLTAPGKVLPAAGRNLMMYCLWEGTRSNSQIEQLQELVQLPKDAASHKAAKEMLASEKWLRDHLMAIALELDDETSDVEMSEDEENDDFIEELPDADALADAEYASKRANEGMRALKANSRSSRTPFVQGATAVNRNLSPSVSPERVVSVLPLNSSNPELFFKQRSFFRDEVRTEANQMLQAAGKEELDETITTWTAILAALQAAEVSVDRCNDLAMQANLFITKSQAQQEGVQDVVGYPARQEIWEALPPHGLNNDELRQTFDISPTDTAWQKLVKSVAQRKDQLWFPNVKSPDESLPQASLPPGFRPSKIVTLKIGSFDPEEYSSLDLTNIKGFRWRYTNTSTLAQRKSMDGIIELHVERILEDDKALIALYGKPSANAHKGRHDVLAHPMDRAGGSIVHGLWDIGRNKPVEDPKWEWFYDGLEKDFTHDYGFKTYEPVPQGDMAEMEAALQLRKEQVAAGALLALSAPTTPKQEQQEPIKIKLSTKIKGKGKTGRDKLIQSPQSPTPAPRLQKVVKSVKKVQKEIPTPDPAPNKAAGKRKREFKYGETDDEDEDVRPPIRKSRKRVNYDETGALDDDYEE